MRLDRLPSLNRPPRNWGWIAASVVLHVVLIGVALRYDPRPVDRTVRYIELGEARGSEMAWAPPSAGDDGIPAPSREPAAPAPPAPAPPSPVIATPRAPAPLAGGGGAAPRADSVPVDTRRRLVPEYGDGRLWVRVGDVEEGRLPAAREGYDVATHVAKVDSALAEKIQTWLDTVPPDSFATRPAPTSTTEIAGQTWGLDGQWIYLGPIKIPTAVLAALPLPSGNYDEAKRAELLRYMRADIMQAATRMKSQEDFRRYVKELRERKQDEREAEQARREAPPREPEQPLIP